MNSTSTSPLSDCLNQSRLCEFPRDIQQLICLAAGCSLCRNQNKLNPNDFTLRELEELKDKVCEYIEGMRESHPEYLECIISKCHLDILPCLRYQDDKNDWFGITSIRFGAHEVVYRVKATDAQITTTHLKLHSAYYTPEVIINLNHFPDSFDPSICRLWTSSEKFNMTNHGIKKAFYADTDIEIFELESKYSYFNNTEGIYLSLNKYQSFTQMEHPKKSTIKDKITWISSLIISDQTKIELCMALVLFARYIGIT